MHKYNNNIGNGKGYVYNIYTSMEINDDLDINIKDYMGQMENGVTSILSIIYKDKFYEGVYWYTDKIQIITFPENLESEMGIAIEDSEYYMDIIKTLRENEAKYASIINNLDIITS